MCQAGVGMSQLLMPKRCQSLALTLPSPAQPTMIPRAYYCTFIRNSMSKCVSAFASLYWHVQKNSVNVILI